ncbi:hypothetical protein PHMEG_00038603, partial [Phytophthora megakarya]
DMYEGNWFGGQVSMTPDRLEPLDSRAGDEDTHAVQQVQRFRNQDTQNKRYRAACKVCSVLKEGKRAKTSTFFCSQCRKEGRVFLCHRPHRKIRGVAVTCGDIWHRDRKNGRLIPPELAGRIRIRRRDPSTERSTGNRTPTPKKKRRTRGASDDEDKSASE